jgi:hypothetical protein
MNVFSRFRMTLRSVYGKILTWSRVITLITWAMSAQAPVKFVGHITGQ